MMREFHHHDSFSRNVLFPERYTLRVYQRYRSGVGSNGPYIVCQPVILERVNVLFHY